MQLPHPLPAWRAEAAEVFASVPARWLKVHVRGEDQGAAPGANVVLAGGDAAGLVAAVSRHLLGGGRRGGQYCDRARRHREAERVAQFRHP